LQYTFGANDRKVSFLFPVQYVNNVPLWGICLVGELVGLGVGIGIGIGIDIEFDCDPDTDPDTE